MSQASYLAPHFKTLARIGFWPPLGPQGEFLLKSTWYKIFRVLVPGCILINTIQSAIYLCTVLGDTSRMVPSLILMQGNINGLIKLLTLNLRRDRIQGLLDTMKGGYFRQTEPHQREVLDRNARSVHQLLRLLSAYALIGSFLIESIPYVDWLMGNEVELYLWVPFDVLRSPVFEIVIIQVVVTVVAQAYGHVTMDCLIWALYSQATAQIQILRHNFENIVQDAENIMKNREQQIFGGQSKLHEQVEDQEVSSDTAHCSQSGVLQGTKLGRLGFSKHGEDINLEDGQINAELQYVLIERFKFCVQHYRKVISFTKEVQSIFTIPLTHHFMTAACVICTLVYNITEMESFLTVQFAGAFTYLAMVLMQLFMYCYHASVLTLESEQLNFSMYSSDWMRTSVRFRKLLLIQMTRFTRTIEPTVAYIIPLSHDTFMKIFQFSYTLFTVLRQQ